VKRSIGAILMLVALVVWFTVPIPLVMGVATVAFALGFVVSGGPRYVWDHLSPAKRY
jgi:hypothetical protein